jgi:hypothetical protein
VPRVTRGRGACRRVIPVAIRLVQCGRPPRMRAAVPLWSSGRRLGSHCRALCTGVSACIHLVISSGECDERAPDPVLVWVEAHVEDKAIGSQGLRRQTAPVGRQLPQRAAGAVSLLAWPRHNTLDGDLARRTESPALPIVHLRWAVTHVRNRVRKVRAGSAVCARSATAPSSRAGLPLTVIT